MLKKFLIGLWVLGVTMVIFFTWSIQPPDANAQGRKVLSGYHDLAVYLDSTGAGKSTQTDSLITGTSNYPLFWDRLGPYSDIQGWIRCSVMSCDTGDAAADVADTTKDSMIYTMYTACDYDNTIRRVVELDSLVKAGSEPTVWITIPSDSGLCDKVYFHFKTIIADTDYSVARASAAVHYRIFYSFTAKE